MYASNARAFTLIDRLKAVTPEALGVRFAVDTNLLSCPVLRFVLILPSQQLRYLALRRHLVLTYANAKDAET